MTFIRKYFMAKVKGYCGVFDCVKQSWKCREWGLVVLEILTIIVMGIFGTLTMPIDIIVCGITWIKDGVNKKLIEAFMDSLILDT